ncbi:iron complex transport system permease protein [Loktanella fryxellensis]|uniref:Iron complex transport system permease protein n=1 Tax=Loktanella fryxellensis TaxID=245187 RepID=A0A1H8HD61_9RHOB|nr:iron ABC transporter permease [Loktanella fryxellensis]SEN54045.1 iron complex transport system permease protein [Loktanella fryxellensis]
MSPLQLTRAGWLGVACAALVLVAALSVTVGTRAVGWADIGAALTGRTETIGQAAVNLRLPRTVLALLAGAALGVAGAVMQGVTRNPPADPGLLGVNAGAALAVVTGIAWFGLSGSQATIWTGIGGAAVASAFVYAVGSLGQGGATPLKLTLAGAATSIAAASFTLALVLGRNDVAGSVQAWQVGGVGGASMAAIAPMLPFLMVGLLAAWATARHLNMLALGDDTASAFGVRVVWARGTALAAAVVLCGVVTAVCGPIGFLGLVVPHLCRLLMGVDHRWLLPASAVVGAGLLTLAYVAGRIVARPSEVDVGIVTALIGAPVFIAILRRQRLRGL